MIVKNKKKTLVCVIGETRAQDLTWNNFNKYLLKNNELRSYLPEHFEELYFFHGIVKNPNKAVKQYLSARNKLKL